jgi:hypothetical protein
MGVRMVVSRIERCMAVGLLLVGNGDERFVRSAIWDRGLYSLVSNELPRH